MVPEPPSGGRGEITMNTTSRRKNELCTHHCNNTSNNDTSNHGERQSPTVSYQLDIKDFQRGINILKTNKHIGVIKMLSVSNGVARSILKATNGQFFSVTFKTRGTGEERTIVGRTGVRKGVNGHGMRYNPAEHDAITVWDNGNVPNAKGEKSQGHKTVPLNDIREVRAGGAKFRVAGHS